MAKKRTAARLLTETLHAHGVDIVYGVPGESFLAVTDALIDFPDMRMIVCRHEGGAAFMALADAKVTRRPGICFVSRGPGATNASIAVHTAQQDATPLLLFIGQIDRRDFGRRGLQEVDYSKTFSDMAKLVIDVRDGELLSDAVARGYQVARTGTPGPVIIVMPEDMLDDDIGDEPVCGPRPMPVSAPPPNAIAEIAALIEKAERPLMIVGGTIDDDDGAKAAVELAEAWGLPVCTVFRRLHQFPNTHPNYAGYLGVRVAAQQIAALMEADLVMAVGGRLGDLPSQGYRFPRAPVPTQPFIHVYPDPGEIGRIWQPTIGVACDPTVFARELAKVAPARRKKPSAWVERLHAIEVAEKAYASRPANDGIAFGAVVSEVNTHLRPDAVVSVDAGNFQTWVTRHTVQGPEGLHLGTLSGAMGGGVPGIVAAGLRDPGRQLVCYVGDGGFLMTGSELATAMQYGVPVKIFISNNASYGSIRWHQENRYPGRVASTELTNPDFALLGKAYGAKGLRIETEADVPGVIAEAMAHDGPVVVDVITSLFYISAHKTLEDVAQDVARRASGS